MAGTAKWRGLQRNIQFLMAGVPGGVRAGAYQWGIRRPDLQRADSELAIRRGCGAPAAVEGSLRGAWIGANAQRLLYLVFLVRRRTRSADREPVCPLHRCSLRERCPGCGWAYKDYAFPHAAGVWRPCCAACGLPCDAVPGDAMPTAPALGVEFLLGFEASLGAAVRDRPIDRQWAGSRCGSGSEHESALSVRLVRTDGQLRRWAA